jgi:hypothetical protein
VWDQLTGKRTRVEGLGQAEVVEAEEGGEDADVEQNSEGKETGKCKGLGPGCNF